jgi:phage shock protein PspC (stress-responsive transcriptional regulator)
MLTGVAAGLAGYLGADVTITRIAFAVLTIAGMPRLRSVFRQVLVPLPAGQAAGLRHA